MAALPQLPILFLAPFGLLALAFDLTFQQDGEWLHEGWPVIEAAVFWAPVPLMSSFASLAAAIASSGRSRLRAGPSEIIR